VGSASNVITEAEHETLEGSSAVLLDNKDEISHEEWLELKGVASARSEVLLSWVAKWATLSVWFQKLKDRGKNMRYPPSYVLLLEPWLLTKLRFG
jgi:hypothetical protein